MTQIANVSLANINQGPRGIAARVQGGAYSQDAQLDIRDVEPFAHSITVLTGTTDAIVPIINAPVSLHNGGNYIVKTGSADAITIPAPTAGVDDNLVVSVFSVSAFAHTITAPSAIIQAGVSVKTTITYPAFPGAGVVLRAFNGFWQIVAQGYTANGLT